MGVGAAACEPGTLSLIRQIYPDRGERARALGVWTAVSGISLALGPVLGGVLDRRRRLARIFWFNLAFGLASFAAAARFVPESSDPQGRRLDVPGLAAGAVALTGSHVRGDRGRERGLPHLVGGAAVRRGRARRDRVRRDRAPHARPGAAARVLPHLDLLRCDRRRLRDELRPLRRLLLHRALSSDRRQLLRLADRARVRRDGRCDGGRRPAFPDDWTAERGAARADDGRLPGRGRVDVRA